MAIVDLTCKKCGGAMQIDNAITKAFCPYCGTPYIVQEEITKQYITNNVHINGKNINVYANKDFDIQGGVLKKYNGEAVNVVIPDNVRVIGGNAFQGLAIEKVTIPGSVIKSEEGQCKLFYNGETYHRTDGGAFAFCTSLKEVVFKNGIKRIGSFSFSGCKSLVSINLPDSVEVIGMGAFERCDSLSSVTCSANMHEIGDSAFQKCISLHSMELPGVTRIGDNAFYDCKNLINVRMPQVVNMGEYVFRGTLMQKQKIEYEKMSIQYFQSIGRCTHCGGEFETKFRFPHFYKQCKNCLWLKTY